MKRIDYGLLLTLTVSLAACSSGGGRGDFDNTSDPDWLLPKNEIWDGGPGQDGIPSIDNPQFELASETTFVDPAERVVGVFVNGEYHAYPHRVLDWHEVVNDSAGSDAFVLSYCPLTGSALAWDVPDNAGNPQYGVSGLLYFSNLILYDRETGSRWSQMLQQSVWGERIGARANQVQVIETTWQTWLSMYPDSVVLTGDTVITRGYNGYPYGMYRTNSDLLFPVPELDTRLHPKHRVIGFQSATGNKAYQVDGFGSSTQAINDHVGGNPIVVIGNSELDLAAIYSRELGDGTILEFAALEDQLPVVMTDTEGNTWDIFGIAVSGPRTGEQLERTTSFTAMWFAWAAFFENTELHFN
ncbi:MAG: DUF3179 domain-containing protein [Woeseiaceae bacterium]|nr:DUF3179 domain-containing protein [Woeseiaceae bacterium]